MKYFSSEKINFLNYILKKKKELIKNDADEEFFSKNLQGFSTQRASPVEDDFFCSSIEYVFIKIYLINSLKPEILNLK